MILCREALQVGGTPSPLCCLLVCVQGPENYRQQQAVSGQLISSMQISKQIRRLIECLRNRTRWNLIKQRYHGYLFVYRYFHSVVPVIRFSWALCNTVSWPNALWLDEDPSESVYMQRHGKQFYKAQTSWNELQCKCDWLARTILCVEWNEHVYCNNIYASYSDRQAETVSRKRRRMTGMSQKKKGWTRTL